MINLEEIIRPWIESARNGTFVSEKHDVADLDTPRDSFRSVSMMGNEQIAKYLEGRDYGIKEYHQNHPQYPSFYFVITPRDTSLVTGSGVPPYSTTPTTSCNRFVVVSGHNQGWHIFAESDTNIQRKTDESKLRYIRDIMD